MATQMWNLSNWWIELILTAQSMQTGCGLICKTLESIISPNSNKLRIKNSMHCYYNATYGYLKQAVNHNDFTFFDFRLVCDDWSKRIFERPEEDFQLSTNFEVGLNIDTEQHSPFDIITRYMSYVTTTVNEFYTCPPFHLKGKPIERMCFLSDYKLKVYDKARQAKLAGQNLLRYEVVYTELRKIRQVLGVEKDELITLKSLSHLDTWRILFDALITMYDGIKKIPMVANPLPINDINDLHGYCNKIMAEDLKKTLNINTYNKRRAKMGSIYKQYDRIESNYHQVVRQKLVNKYNRLIEVQQFQTL